MTFLETGIMKSASGNPSIAYAMSIGFNTERFSSDTLDLAIADPRSPKGISARPRVSAVSGVGTPANTFAQQLQNIRTGFDASPDLPSDTPTTVATATPDQIAKQKLAIGIAVAVGVLLILASGTR